MPQLHRLPATAGAPRGLFEPRPWHESIDWRISPVLAWALAGSVLFHFTLMFIKFVDPEGFNRVFQDKPMDIVLVNARTNDAAPVKEQALAQTNLAGGGEAESGYAASPMVAAPFDTLGDNDRESAQRIENLLQQQEQILAQLKQEEAAMPVPDPRQRNLTPAQQQLEEAHLRRLKAIAAIEKTIREQNARPRKAFVSPSTRKAVYAQYYDLYRTKVEVRGTTNFPTQNGRKLYGSLTMQVTIDADGEVVDTVVVRSSGSRVLDQRAVAIARAAAPYGKFSDELRRKTDQIVLTSTFHFTSAGLETQQTGSSQ